MLTFTIIFQDDFWFLPRHLMPYNAIAATALLIYKQFKFKQEIKIQSAELIMSMICIIQKHLSFKFRAILLTESDHSLSINDLVI